MSNAAPPPGFPPPPPNQGMSTGTKVLLGVGCFALVCVALCCGGAALFFTGVSTSVQQSAERMNVTDPAKVLVIANELAETDLYTDFQPELAKEMRIPVVNTKVFKLAKFTGSAERTLTIVAWNEEMSQGKGLDDLLRESRELQQPHHHGNAPDDGAQSTEIQVKDLKVRGKPARFQIIKLKHTPRGGQEAEYWQVAGTFEGREGRTVLMLFAPRTDYTLEHLITDIESIK